MSFQGPLPDRGEFSIHNIQFGVISTPHGQPRRATTVGDFVLDLQRFAQHGYLKQVAISGTEVDLASVFSKVELK
ncbi:uncharacterized protein A1O9_03958 [Exophiala aquamarina CBS 119918]|uniref:Fumarylacetoacetase N-terminal domain-containing protein n=1 Tax=Exophiala aquamarina CBS 119918 TaxID=1182545 RepID=A0A072PG44_9EURO|nr:uncharacterized protein A1O9_03958 [Exophiala aquamarina CBS 119918]KEF59114.1 hypothetical protein A1O9_03958 [Exophiala aquamarina CBS 119918]